jgi:hypothetical protein
MARAKTTHVRVALEVAQALDEWIARCYAHRERGLGNWTSDRDYPTRSDAIAELLRKQGLARRRDKRAKVARAVKRIKAQPDYKE